MVLVDTSVWIEHFRKGKPQLVDLLDQAAVLMHPFVLGELACGNLNNRAIILNQLRALPEAVSATHHETLSLIERRKLWARGIGLVDAHLLASALLSNCDLWTLHEKLNHASAEAGVRYE